MSTTPLPRPGPELGPVGSRRAIPFDYAFTYQLTATPGRVISQTVTVSIEAAFTAVAMGYGVVPEVAHVTFGPGEVADLDLIAMAVPTGLPPALANIVNLRSQLFTARATLLSTIKAGKPGPSLALSQLPPDTRSVLVVPPRQVTLGDMINALSRALGEDGFASRQEIGPLTEAALRTGVRLNPDVARYFLLAKPGLSLQPGQLARLFETVSAPPDRIQFLYALYDEGSGREFQSDPILNISGLGSSDGVRPFRYFAQPITFAPRTTIRLDITEKSEFKGELHVSLHGFKVLGGAGTPTGRAGRRRRRLR